MCGCGRKTVAFAATVANIFFAPAAGFVRIPALSAWRRHPGTVPERMNIANANPGVSSTARSVIHPRPDGEPSPGGESEEQELYAKEPEGLYSERWPTAAELDAMPKTFKQFIERQVWRDPETEEGLIDVLDSLARACREVSTLVRRAQTDGIAGACDGGVQNVQGETQKRLDVLSNTIFAAGLCGPGNMECIASEEDEFPRSCAEVCHADMGGKYVTVFDPLDGSANIEAGLPCGTIFGLLRRPDGASGSRAVLQPGNRLVAAGYCLYGARTELVVTMGKGVHGFTLDLKRNNFVLTSPKMEIPKQGDHYSFNEANAPRWDERVRAYVETVKRGRGVARVPYEHRYAGALIADVHRVLQRGGIFGYPADTSNPNGKLRLLYEGNPIAMIMEQAGGAATTGFERILDVRPLSTHHRVPAFFGSIEDVQELTSFTKQWV